jgi:hypothetical protein
MRVQPLEQQHLLSKSAVDSRLTYRIDGQQYVSVISGHTLVTFALRN